MSNFQNNSQITILNVHDETSKKHLEFFVPGAIFTVFGLWWTVQVTKAFYHARWKHLEFQSALIYSCSILKRQVPLEGMVKVCIFVIGISVITLTMQEDYFGKTAVNMTFFRTVIILVVFLLSGVTDILSQVFSHSIPPGLDYCVLVLAFFVEAVLFGHYIPEDISLTTTVESPVTYCALLCAIVTALELQYRSQVLFAFFRSYFTLLQGTWLCQTSFIVQLSYTDAAAWQTDNPDHIAIISIYFVVHCIICFIILVSLWFLAHRLAKHSMCCCVPVSTDHSNEFHLENRVNFDYHILDRLGSDVD